MNESLQHGDQDPTEHSNLQNRPDLAADPVISTDEHAHGSNTTYETPDVTPPAEDISDPERRQVFHDHWVEQFNQDLSWNEFSSLCTTFAEQGYQLGRSLSNRRPSQQPDRANRPSSRPVTRPPHGRFRQRFDPAEAQQIQRLYKNSKKRAARKILMPDSPFYTGSVNNADTFFRQIFSEQPCDIPALQSALRAHIPTGPTDETLFQAPSAAEIKAKMRTCSNTSPGPDRIEYRHLKAIDPKCEILALIFSHCINQQDVPNEWKNAITVLIHKKNSTEDPSNFRPIALMSCIYKLLTGVLAKRLSRWSIENEILSPEQKSARPTEGCYEHSFLLQSLVGDARRNQKNIFLAWLDLRNAFGSIPHTDLSTTLTHIGAPKELVQMVTNIYTNSSTQIRAGSDLTNSIPLLAGVKQGCPMSAILFNLSIELILRQAKNTANTIGPAKHHDTIIHPGVR